MRCFRRHSIFFYEHDFVPIKSLEYLLCLIIAHTKLLFLSQILSAFPSVDFYPSEDSDFGSMRVLRTRQEEMCMAGKTYGYARVSSKDQNLDRQLVALAEFGVKGEMVFADKASGKDFDRPEYRRLVATLAEGDVVVVKSIDRLGRNYDEILSEWRAITKERKSAVVVLDMPLLDTREKPDGLTSVLIADIVLQLLSYVAQVERENIKQRQAEGIAAARARGVRFGRPRKKRPACYKTTKESYLEGRITRQEAADRMKVCVTTFDRWLKSDLEQEDRTV